MSRPSKRRKAAGKKKDAEVVSPRVQVEGGEMARAAATIEDLPDDVLLRVFGQLDAAFLSGPVSRVCRRWQGLASDPVLWVDVSLSYRSAAGAAAAAAFQRALAVAPLLEGLECVLTDQDPPALRRALETTRISVAHLCVDLEAAAPGAVLRLLANSRRSLQLLCVREGPLCSGFSDCEARRFWQLVEQCTRLRSLVLLLSEHSGLVSSRHSFRPRASHLEMLFVELGVLQEGTVTALDHTVQSLILAHRNTLLEVSLPRLGPSPRALSAVCRCSRLERVCAPASQDIAALASCARLRKLRVTLDHAPPADLLDKLSQLQQLTHLRLSQLLSRPSQLPQLPELLAVLPRLQEVALPRPPAQLQLMPRQLQVLSFEQGCDAEGCRLPVFRCLLRQHPHLHLVLESLAAGPGCGADHRSVVTAQGVQLQAPVAFVGHAADAGCDYCPAHRLRGGGVFHFDCLHVPEDTLRAEGIAVWVVDVPAPLPPLPPPPPPRRAPRRACNITIPSAFQDSSAEPSQLGGSRESQIPAYSSTKTPPAITRKNTQESTPPKVVLNDATRDSAPESDIFHLTPADSSPPSASYTQTSPAMTRKNSQEVVSSDPYGDSTPVSDISRLTPGDSSPPSASYTQTPPAITRKNPQEVVSSDPTGNSTRDSTPVSDIFRLTPADSSPPSASYTQTPPAITRNNPHESTPPKVVSNDATVDSTPVSDIFRLTPVDSSPPSAACSQVVPTNTTKHSTEPITLDDVMSPTPSVSSPASGFCSQPPLDLISMLPKEFTPLRHVPSDATAQSDILSQTAGLSSPASALLSRPVSSKHPMKGLLRTAGDAAAQKDDFVESLEGSTSLSSGITRLTKSVSCSATSLCSEPSALAKWPRSSAVLSLSPGVTVMLDESACCTQPSYPNALTSMPRGIACLPISSQPDQTSQPANPRHLSI